MISSQIEWRYDLDFLWNDHGTVYGTTAGEYNMCHLTSYFRFPTPVATVLRAGNIQPALLIAIHIACLVCMSGKS